MHRFLLHNRQVVETSAKTVSAGQVGFLNGWGVFSTIRVVEGVLFAWERHWARMSRDAARLRVPLPADADQVYGDLLSLVEANHALNATMRVCAIRNRGGMFEGAGIERDVDLVAFTTDLHDWGDGVNLCVQPNARHAACPFAGTKILSWSMNLAWLEAARANGFDEAILLNEHGMVSECTSANIFLASGDRVFTPPLTSGCLPGVTRELLLNEIGPSTLPVIEQDVRVEDLYAADSVFITSTTRILLPVLSIAGQKLRDRGDLRHRLEAGFNRHLAAYVAGKQALMKTP